MSIASKKLAIRLHTALTVFAAAFLILWWLSRQTLREFLRNFSVEYNFAIGLLVLFAFFWIGARFIVWSFGFIVHVVVGFAGRQAVLKALDDVEKGKWW